MHGCEVILENINFMRPKRCPSIIMRERFISAPIFLSRSLLVRVSGVEWMLKDTDFPTLPVDFDMRGLVLLRPEKVVFAMETEGGVRKKSKVMRNQFKIGYSNARTTYGA